MIPKATKRFAEAIRTDAVDAHGAPVWPWGNTRILGPDHPHLCAPHCRQQAPNPNQEPAPGQAAQPITAIPDFLILYLQHSIARLDARIEHLLIDTGELLISVIGIAASALFNSSVNCCSYSKRCRPGSRGPRPGLIHHSSSPAPVSTKNRLSRSRHHPLYARSERCMPRS